MSWRDGSYTAENNVRKNQKTSDVEFTFHTDFHFTSNKILESFTRFHNYILKCCITACIEHQHTAVTDIHQMHSQKSLATQGQIIRVTNSKLQAECAISIFKLNLSYLL